VDAYDRGDVQNLATGQLLTADNQIDTTRTDKLKAVFDNRDQSLFPNQFVNIHLVLEDRPNALRGALRGHPDRVAGSLVCVGRRQRRQGRPGSQKCSL